MAEDKLGKFLFENHVPPDDFSYFRKRILGEDIAVIETAYFKSFPMTDERGQMVDKLIPHLVQLSLLRLNFSVRFIDGETPKEIASYNGLSDDPNQLELIRVEYCATSTEGEEGEEEDAVAALFSNHGYDDTDNMPLFLSYDGMLLTTHPEHSEDTAQPPADIPPLS